MKKWIAIMISLSMVFCFTACSGAGTGESSDTDAAATTAEVATTEAAVSGKDQAVETADQFLKSFAEGDLENMGKYCTEDVQEEMHLTDMEEELTNAFSGQTGTDGEAYEPSEEAKTTIKEAISTVLKACIEKYELGQVEGEDGQTSYDVPAVIYVRNANDVDLDMDTFMSESLNGDTYAELMRIAQEEGQNAMYDYILINVMPKLFESMSTQIEAQESEAKDVVITVEEQQDGTWLVTKLSGLDSVMPSPEEDGADAAEASTQQ